MSKSGGVGGVTLSSLRMQKALSINFRENKRLGATLKVIEGDHARSLRRVKQEITDTKIWLEGVQENTGYSQHGIPNMERPHTVAATVSRKMSLPASIVSAEKISPTPTTARRPSRADILYGQQIKESTDMNGPISRSPTHVRFSWTAQEPRRASRDFTPADISQILPPQTAAPETGVILQPRPYNRRKSFLPKEDRILPLPIEEQQEEAAEPTEEEVAEIYGGALVSEPKTRIRSASSVRSNQSLNPYQRRHMLQSMVVKKQSLLLSKKDIHKKECLRVNAKVLDYLNNLAERMKITLPDMSKFDFDPNKHNTPFARNVNVTT